MRRRIGAAVIVVLAVALALLWLPDVAGATAVGPYNSPSALCYWTVQESDPPQPTSDGAGLASPARLVCSGYNVAAIDDIKGSMALPDGGVWTFQISSDGEISGLANTFVALNESNWWWPAGGNVTGNCAGYDPGTCYDDGVDTVFVQQFTAHDYPGVGTSVAAVGAVQYGDELAGLTDGFDAFPLDLSMCSTVGVCGIAAYGVEGAPEPVGVATVAESTPDDAASFVTTILIPSIVGIMVAVVGSAAAFRWLARKSMGAI
jgi:hypothetical protein